MKVWNTLALFMGLSSAVAIPEPAPSSFQTSTGHPTEMHDFGALTKVPHELVNRDEINSVVQRREVLKQLRGVSAVNDFYECATSGNPPKSTDCGAVISNVYAQNNLLSVAPRACLLFEFGTCWGFFCSLCVRLSTDTDFVGNQLQSAQDLCVSGGSAGTIVGEGSPQWEAGFIRQGGTLPNYDVC